MHSNRREPVSDGRIRQYKDPNQSGRELEIVKRYDEVFSYLYPRILSMHNKHHIFKELFFTALTKQPELFYTAGISGQISKLREADKGLAYIRWMLRTATIELGAKFGMAGIEEAERRIYIVGSMLNAWMKNIERHKDAIKGNKQ